MITTDSLAGLTAPPPAAPESAEPKTPVVPAAPETPAAPSGEKAVQAAEKAKNATVRERMKAATQAAKDMVAGTAPATPATPVAEAPAAEAVAAPEEIDPNAIAWDQTAGRWRDPATGNFVPAPEGATPPEAEQPAPAEAVSEEGQEAQPAEDANLITVALPRPGGGEDVTIDIDDPEVAELVQHYKNNGMRREEFNKRIASVEQKEADFREFQARMQYAPESLVDALSPENTDRFATYLLAKHFDRFLPMLQGWAENDLTRQQALLYSERQSFASRQQLEQSIAAQRSERAILKAVDNLIPDHASPADADDFRQAAIARLTTVAQSGRDVRPETVVQHLDRDIRRFGFLPPVEPDPTKTPSLVPTQTAPGAKSAPQPATVAQRAKEQQERLAAVAQQRRAAAPIAPRGTGAAPATGFPRPASFKDATKLVNTIPAEQWQHGFGR